MTISQRLGLIVLGFIVVVVGGLVFTGQLREELLRQDGATRAARQLDGVWNITVDVGLRDILQQVPLATGDRALRAAFEEMDRARVATAAGRVVARLRQTGDVDRLEVIEPDGQIAYSSAVSFQPDTPLRAELVAEALESGEVVAGIGNDANRNVTLSVGQVVHDVDGQPLALLVLSSAIHRSLEQLREASDAEVLIVNRRGRFLDGTAPQLWEDIRYNVDLRREDTQSAQTEVGAYELILLPLRADVGTLVARLVVARDVTAATAVRERIGWISLGLVLLFVGATLLGLSFYIHRSLSPLSAGAQLLNALSQGDVSGAARVEAPDGDDELARIGRAINAFREQTLALRQQRRLRDRLRRRQETFIRGEMIRLAETLQGDVKSEILSELSDIEKRVHTMEEDDTREKKEEVDFSSGLHMTALALEKMTDRVAGQHGKLTELVEDLRQALKARRALVSLQRDLEIAGRVQLSFLPDQVYRADGLEVRGSMMPARDVGGDFFDYFEIDENRIALVIADVVGKGVPAALFMAVSRTTIRAMSVRFPDEPGRCLEAVNDMLVASTAGDAFVTVFYGVYDRRDHSFVYANGGHNAPLMAANGEVSELPPTKGVLLSMIPDLTYNEHRLQLPPGGMLFLFTDGIPECINAGEEEFGEERMEAVLREAGDATPSDVMEKMLMAVDGHVSGEEQFDDVTMLVLKREPGEDRVIARRVVLRNDLEEVDVLLKETGAFCERIGVAEAEHPPLQEILEEVFTNVVNYAFPEGGRHDIRVRFALEEGSGGKPELLVTFQDPGSEFNALEPPESGGYTPFRQRVGEFMDEVSYARKGQSNILSLRKRITPA